MWLVINGFPVDLGDPGDPAFRVFHPPEPKSEARGFYGFEGFYGARWPSCLTDLEYSNRCYADNAFSFTSL